MTEAFLYLCDPLAPAFLLYGRNDRGLSVSLWSPGPLTPFARLQLSTRLHLQSPVDSLLMKNKDNAVSNQATAVVRGLLAV